MKTNEIEYCLTNLQDVMDICRKKEEVSKLQKERILLKSIAIYDTLKEQLPPRKQVEW